MNSQILIFFYRTLDEDGQPKRSLRLRVPRVFRRNIDNDIDPITDQMETGNSSTRPAAIVVHSPSDDI